MISGGPANVYLDTDLLVYAAIADLSHTKACRDSLESLLHSNSVVHYSVLLRMEYLQAIRNLATRRQLSPEVRRTFDLDQWGDSSVRRRWIEHGLDQLDALLEGFAVTVELPMTRFLVDVASRHVAVYALRSHDAVHLATALHYEIPVFWTCDDHFARVNDLHVEIIRDHS